jgi:hypothetical protein
MHKSLKAFQKAFGESISIPFLWNKGNYSLDMSNYSETIVQDIVPIPGKYTKAKRLGLYNEQYWFRLLSLFHSELPLATNLLGYYNMNRLTSQYLKLYPSSTPDLSNIMQYMEPFLQSDFIFKSDQIVEAIKIDCIYSALFTQKNTSSWKPWILKESQLEELLSQPIDLIPSLEIVNTNWDFIENRPKIAQNPDQKIAFKKTQKVWIIFRNEENLFYSKPMHPLGVRILKKMQSGSSILNILGELQNTLADNELEVLQSNLQLWFKDWTNWKIFKQPEIT